jgi:hypothetical protein
MSGAESDSMPSGVVIFANRRARCSSCFDIASAMVGMLATK